MTRSTRRHILGFASKLPRALLAGGAAATFTIGHLGLGTSSAEALTPSPNPPQVDTQIPAAALETRNTLEQTQWALAASNITQAWPSATGKGVTVAVLDSGIVVGPEFADRIAHAAIWEDGRIVPVDPEAMEDYLGHGTHVAGIIGAARDNIGITGVAYNATILPVALAITGSEANFVASVIGALNYAAEKGADVANISAGFTDVYAIESKELARNLCQTVDEVTSKGMLVVASAGNDGNYDNLPTWPGGCSSVMTVSAVDTRLEPTQWSSYGYNVDIAAPGAAILSTVPEHSLLFGSNPYGYAFADGTSMAAPLVSAVAALIKEQHPNWTPQQIAQRMRSTAHDIAAPGEDALTGSGIVNAAAATGAYADYPSAQAWLTSQTRLGLTGEDPCQESCLYLSWRATTTEPSNISITIYSQDGSQRTSEHSGTVRAWLTEVAETDWVQITAHYPGATLAMPPRPVGAQPYNPPGTDETSIAAVKRVKNDRIKIDWESTYDGPVDRVVLSITGYDPMTGVSVLGKVILTGSSATKAGTHTIRLPKRARGFNIYVDAYLRDAGQVKDWISSYESLPPRSGINLIAESAGKNAWNISGSLTGAIGNQADFQCQSRPGRCLGIQAHAVIGKSAATSALNMGTFTYVMRIKKLPTQGTVSFTSLSAKLPEALSRAYTGPIYILGTKPFRRVIN